MSVSYTHLAAVEFVFGLAGIMAMWSGLVEIAERTGLINSLSRFLMPFTKLLFPKQRDPETLSSIITVSYTHLDVYKRQLLQEALNSPTIVVLTDRNDLDDQLYGQFAKCKDFLRQEPMHLSLIHI